MFCNYCGSPNPDDAAYCSTCGRVIARSKEPNGSPISVAVSALDPKEDGSRERPDDRKATRVSNRTPPPVSELPYRWGKVFGWLAITASLLILLSVAVSAIGGNLTEGIAPAFFALVALPMGIGLVKKALWGFRLLLAVVMWLFLGVIEAITSAAEPRLILWRLITFLAWVLISSYYYKRLSEFT